MKKVYSFIRLFITAIFSFCSIVYSQSFEITHYNLQFEIIPNEHKLIAESEFSIKSLNKDFTEKLELFLSCDLINSVKDIYGNDLKFSKEDGKVIIWPKHTSDDSLIIKLNYEGVFQGWVSNRIDAKSSWLLSESNYYPRISNEDYNNKFSFNIKVTVPDSINVVCSGGLIKMDTSNRKRSFYYSSKIPESFLSISAAVYKIKEYDN